MRFLIALLIIPICVGRVCGESPEVVVSTYFKKVKAEGFGSIADLMHPDELRKLRELMLPIVEDSLATEEEPTFKSFADDSDPKKAAKMTDAEFMNRFMMWVSDLNPALQQTFRGASIETLGHVVEGDLKHVVVRMRMSANGIDIAKMSVMTIKDYEGKPLMTLAGDIKGLAESLARKKGKK